MMSLGLTGSPTYFLITPLQLYNPSVHTNVDLLATCALGWPKGLQRHMTEGWVGERGTSHVIIPTTMMRLLSVAAVYSVSKISASVCEYQMVWHITVSPLEREPNHHTGDPAQHTRLQGWTHPKRCFRSSLSQLSHSFNNVELWHRIYWNHCALSKRCPTLCNPFWDMA